LRLDLEYAAIERRLGGPALAGAAMSGTSSFMTETVAAPVPRVTTAIAAA
jgi:hypothetical protein